MISSVCHFVLYRIFLICIYFIVLLLISISCHSQSINYQCNFDNDMTGDCQFTAPNGGGTLSPGTGSNPTGKPTQPLSDVSSIRTYSWNESCYGSLSDIISFAQDYPLNLTMSCAYYRIHIYVRKLGDALLSTLQHY